MGCALDRRYGLATYFLEGRGKQKRENGTLEARAYSKLTKAVIQGLNEKCL
jgi:hypothetical protein